MTRYSSESRKGILSDQSRINEMEYFQSIYPQNLKILQRYVEEECDRLDYKGSPIYDEYPDMQVIRQVCKKICSNIPAFGETWEIQTERMRNRWKSMKSVRKMQTGV